MRNCPFLLLFGVLETEKSEFCECASTLNFEIFYLAKVKSSREILIYTSLLKLIVPVDTKHHLN